MIILLSIISAIFHPFRDVILKGKEPRYDIYMLSVSGWVFISFWQILITQGSFLIDYNILYYCIFSSFGNLLYYGGIAFTLRYGNVSVYFPIFRSSPFIIAFFNYLLWGTIYKPMFLVGVLLIVFGVVFIHNGFDIFKKKNKTNSNSKKSLLFALLALVGSVIYIIADARAMLYHPSEATYLFYNYLFCSIMFFVGGIFAYKKTKPSHKNYIVYLFDLYKKYWSVIAFSTITDYTSYFCILLAESSGGDMVLVNSIRLWDIPISVILARLILKEQKTLYRLGATLFILAGSILAKMYG